MPIPEKYLPKINALRTQIPVYNCHKKNDFHTKFMLETPFILNSNLESITQTVEKNLNQVEITKKIKTYDSIPWKEIREGSFGDYINYVFNKDSSVAYPENFKVIDEKHTENITQTSFRHYALSLNEEIFPAIKNIRIPFIEDSNYLLQIEAKFFKKHNITSPHWLFIHPKHSVSNAHFDHDAVHTAIFQLKGSKRAFLISPEHHAYIRNNAFPLLPNGFNDFSSELLNKMSCEDLVLWEGCLGENQILFIPRNWVHYVVGETSGISYSQDIVIQNNFSDWMFSIFSNF